VVSSLNAAHMVFEAILLKTSPTAMGRTEHFLGEGRSEAPQNPGSGVRASLPFHPRKCERSTAAQDKVRVGS